MLTLEKADVAMARSGETARLREWMDELLKTGIRGKGQKLMLAELEPLPGTLADRSYSQTWCTA